MSQIKRTRRKNARPGEILNAATKMFLTNGFSKTALRDIAKAADISRTTIYLYFKTKEDLFLRVVRSIINDYSEDIQKNTTKSGKDIKENVTDIIDLIYTVTGNQKYLKLLLIFITESERNDFLKQLFYSEIFKKIIAPIRAQLKKANKAQECGDVVLSMIAGSFFISSFASMIFSHKNSLPPSRHDLKEALPKLILNSLAKSPFSEAKE